MKLYKIDPNKIDYKIIKEAAQIIRDGGLVIFPTETVYGLACDAFNETAIKKVFEAKGRNDSKPLPVMIPSIDNIKSAAAKLNENSLKLGNRYWPGPLTMVVEKNPNIPLIATAGLNCVGVRVPKNKIALALLSELGSPIIATSANLSDSQPPSNAEDAIKQLGNKVDLVLDGGTCGSGVASTVLDLTVMPAKILRQGFITKEMIIEVIGEEDIEL